MKSGIKRMHPGLVILLLAVLIFAISSAASGLTAKPQSNTPAKELPTVGSYEKLKSLLEGCQRNSLYKSAETRALALPAAAVTEGSMNSAPAADQAQNAKQDYSSTNVQVEGVDEADLVKTDGKYIFQVNKQRIQVISAVPANKMQVINTIKFSDTGFTPADLYLDGDKLIVIGNSNQNMPEMYKNGIVPRGLSICRAVVYDIKDKTNIKQTRRLELEGNYLSSRKVGSTFYLLSNCYANYAALQNGQEAVPVYRDTVKKDELAVQDIKAIRYFPGFITPNYLVTGSINLNREDQAADINTYLGGGENVYASAGSLYVAVTDYNYSAGNDIVPQKKIAAQPEKRSTVIYKFNLKNSQLIYSGEGKVPGTILNQFSMDEYMDNFRIATTTGDTWRNDENISKNNVYILDKDLKLQGKIEDIAPGEKIYSTRFMGNRAYMVTFKKVDPFFVLDLKDPAQPKILGKLKIPGYSDYLHPYDENHIIGFGKDTIEASGYNGQSMAFYQGMKIAIFDVSDVSKPVEMSKVTIGDRGTDSELLRNHKALLFSREKNLLALPVNVMTLDNNANKKITSTNIPEYGSFSFQGAYVYSIDLKQGLQLKGRITHLNDEDYKKAGDYWNNPDKSIERILYIGDNLYTLSSGMVKTNKISDLKELQSLPLN